MSPPFPDYSTLGVQGLAGYIGGFASSPLMQMSNKSCLPNVSVHKVLRMTSKTPFVGANWAAIRQSLSSVRGTTSILYMRNCLEKRQKITFHGLFESHFGGLSCGDLHCWYTF